MTVDGVATKFAFFHIKSLLIRCFVNDPPSSFFPRKDINVDLRNIAAVYDFLFLNRAHVSLIAPPLCSLPCVKRLLV